MNLYFECNNGISGDMAVAALLDLGAEKSILEKVLNSLNINDEFSYKITNVLVNSIKATDFDVRISHKTEHVHETEDCHHHEHRNLYDINILIEKSSAEDNAKQLAKKIFKIVAEAEAAVHDKPIEEVHFHEVGAIDSIIDILSFSVLLTNLKPEKIYFSTLSEGQGSVICRHGSLSVPVPAVCEIVSKYQIPIKITENNGEMITPTGAAIVAALYSGKKLNQDIIIQKTGYGAGKRKYPNPVLRIMQIK